MFISKQSAFKKQFCFIFFLSVSCTLFAGMNKSFFKKLQTTPLKSSDAVKWTQFGPGMAGYCEEFWCHPTNENVMFMSPDMYNTYGTWDNGKSWKTIKNYDGDGKDLRRVQSIAFSHKNQKFGFALDVQGKLYKTENLGKSWTKVKFSGDGKHSEIVVDPNNDKNWFIGAGCFWDVKKNHRSKKKPLGVTYKYAAYGHIYVSTNKGKTWKKKTKGLPKNLDVGNIVVDPTNSQTVIVAASSGVYRSTDQGNSWAMSGEGLPNNNPREMVSYYNKKKKEFILYLVEQTVFEADGESVKCTGGVFKSIDHGVSWVDITGNLFLDLNEIDNYTTKDKYYNTIGHWFGMKKGKMKDKFPDLPNKILPVFNRLRVNPLNKDEIYVSNNVKHDKSFGPSEVWKTSDGGKTWIAVTRAGAYWPSGKDSEYWKSRNNPTEPNITFAHLHKEMQTRKGETVGNRFFEMNKKGDLFACIEQQIIRSNNGGDTWEQIDDYETEPGSRHWVGRGGSNLPGRYMLLETGIKSRYLLCSGEHGLWQTAPLGSFKNKRAIAVEQIEGQVHHKGATSIASVAVHPKDPKIIYMIMFRQNHRGFFRRSTDGGKSWENLSEPLAFKGNKSMEHIFQYSLTIDPVNPDNIYFCVMANPVAEVSGQRIPKGFKTLGVMKSSDGGKSWALANNGLPTGCSVRRIKMDPHNSNTLYAALNEGPKGGIGGLYISKDNAEEWEKMKIPSEIRSVNNVFIDRNKKYLYISCGREKGTMKEGGVWRSKNKGRSWEKIFDMPYIWQTEVSPINPKVIMVNVASHKKSNKKYTVNPGAYLSTNGGNSWKKININLGQPDSIVDLKPDPYTPGIYWCALKGSGWAVGYSKGVRKGWEELNAKASMSKDKKKSLKKRLIRRR